MTPLRVGVLGCADIARRRMLPAFAACDDTVVTAVAGRDTARTSALAAEYGARSHGTYGDLLADAHVDAVYVPLPLALHDEWTDAALRAGKHVLAEKPVTPRADRTEALFALARERGLALRENVMFVHHRQHAAVRKLLADGAVGELRAFRAEFTVPRRPADDIRYEPALAGGALWDTGVYPLRAAMLFLSGELDVVGAALTSTPGFDVDTAGAALLRTPTGVTAHLTWGLDHAYRNTYELCGSRGRLTVDRVFTPPADHDPVAVLETPSGREEIPLGADDQVAGSVRAFASAARAPDPGPERDCLRQAALLAAVRRRAAGG